MAKKKGKRAPKMPAEFMTPADLNEKANELRELADQIDRYAKSMESMGVEKLKVLVGNWQKAQSMVRNFIGQQLVGKLIVEAGKMGEELHKVFEQPSMKR